MNQTAIQWIAIAFLFVSVCALAIVDVGNDGQVISSGNGNDWGSQGEYLDDINIVSIDEFENHTYPNGTIVGVKGYINKTLENRYFVIGNSKFMYPYSDRMLLSSGEDVIIVVMTCGDYHTSLYMIW